MKYRITLRSNPRLLVVPVLVLAILAAAFLLLSASVVVGVVALALGGYLAYVMIRFIMRQLKCALELTEDALVLDLYGEETIAAPWSDVTHAGVAQDTRRRRVAYLYREGEDKLLAIPDEFERFDTIAGEMAAHLKSVRPNLVFQSLTLGPGQTIRDWLRDEVGPKENGGQTSE